MTETRLILCVTTSLWLAIAAGWAHAQELVKVGCEATENGRPAAASFRAVRSGTQIATGICGKYADIPPGPLTLVVTLDGVLANAERHIELVAKAGPPIRASAQFETGTLLVEVTRDGRRSSALVHLMEANGKTARTSAGVEARVGTGAYTVEVESRGDRKRLDSVTIARGARQVLKVDFAAPAK